MRDSLDCHICGNKYRNLKLNNKHLFRIGKTSNFIERTCTGPNHCLQLTVDEVSGHVDLLRVSLNPKYSVFLEVNFIKMESIVQYYRNSINSYSIKVPKVMDIDFPNLTKVKEKVAVYVTFL
jgi:hypothetical protein